MDLNVPTDNHFRKGILLAGGSGSRLDPLTRATSKQLLPIYDKPMVYYPLSVLMLAGIRQILIISTPQDIDGFKRLLSDGSRVGLSIEYAVQPRPEGLAQAFVIGREFVGDDSCALALGDNLLYSPDLRSVLHSAAARRAGATIFGCRVRNPQQYGVVEFDGVGRIVSLEEKPAIPRSSYAVPGLYFYDNDVLNIAARLKPSPRGELEITDLNREYLERGCLHVEQLGDDVVWMDAGTHESLFLAAQFVRAMEGQHGLKIGCIEEVAFRERFIDATQLERLAKSIRNDYGQYLLDVLAKNCDMARLRFAAAA
jgi:glucose-1-phosphate thymidylyltransferase